MSDKKSDLVLYFYTAESPFVEKDIEILRQEYHVNKFFFNLYNKKGLFFILFKQTYFLVKNIYSCRVIVSQFAGLHSVLPVLFAKLFFKKSVIVSGGTDCVSFPSINYGNFSKKNAATFTRFCFKNTSLIIPVHESLVFTNYTYQSNDYPAQGIKYFIPELSTKINVIYNGYDSTYWRNTVGAKEPRSFITVLGHLNSRFTIQLKGIDLFISLATRFPNARFTIVGGSEIKIDNKPSNLELLPNIWGEKLVHVFSAKQFYVQLSMSEGFPNALSEAMLCECVPIVSNVGGMPDIVADCGHILNEKKEELLYDIIDKVLQANSVSEIGIKARQRVKENYSFEIRQKRFLNSIHSLLEDVK